MQLEQFEGIENLLKLTRINVTVSNFNIKAQIIKYFVYYTKLRVYIFEYIIFCVKV